MAYEPTGPGGVNNSYGVRETTPSTKYSPNVRYDEEFTPKDNTIVTAQMNPVTGGLGKSTSDLYSAQADGPAIQSLFGGVTPKIIAKQDANTFYMLMPKAGARGTGLLYRIGQGSIYGDAGAGSVGGSYQFWRVIGVTETLRSVGCLHTPSGSSGAWTGPTNYSFAGQASGFGVGAWNAVKFFQTTEQNAYKEYSVTVGKGGKFSVGFIVGPGRTTGAKVSIDGIDADTFSLVMPATDVWVKEYIAAPGVHTVRVTKTDSGAQPLQVFGCNFYDADQFPDGNNLDALGYARTANHYKNANGSIDYALMAAGSGKFAGSYHGGETSVSAKVLLDGVDITAAAIGAVFAGRDIRLVQDTVVNTTAGNVTIQSVTQFLRSGGHTFQATADCGDVPLSYFYTHMDVLELGFNKLTYPLTIDMSGYANNSQIPLGPAELTVLENPTTGQRAATWSRQFETAYNAYNGARVWVSSGNYFKPYNGPVVDFTAGRAIGKLSWMSAHAYF